MMLLKHTLIMVSYCKFRHSINFKCVCACPMRSIMTETTENKTKLLCFIQVFVCTKLKSFEINKMSLNMKSKLLCLAAYHVASMHDHDSMIKVMKRIISFVVFLSHAIEKTNEFFDWNRKCFKVILLLHQCPNYF